MPMPRLDAAHPPKLDRGFDDGAALRVDSFNALRRIGSVLASTIRDSGLRRECRALPTLLLSANDVPFHLLWSSKGASRATACLVRPVGVIDWNVEGRITVSLELPARSRRQPPKHL